MNWALLALGVCSLALGAERAWRLRDEASTLAQRSINVALFSVGLAASAYAYSMTGSVYYPFAQAIWYVTVCVLIGCLELTFLALRVENVARKHIWRISIQSVAIAMALLAMLPEALERRIVTRGVDTLWEHDLASIVYLVMFPAYVIWGLLQPVHLSIPRIYRDMRRRPINTAALLLVTIGIGWFAAINAMLAILLNTGHGDLKPSITAYSPLALAVCVTGAALLAVGERLYEEVTAHLQLKRMAPLWHRMLELSNHDFHLPDEHLSTPARLQRSYVEISDAICSLRLDIKAPPTLASVVMALKRGAITDDPAVPTLSRAFPQRTTRREDLELIWALANAYRKHRIPVTQSQP